MLGSQISAIAYPLPVLALTSSPALAGIVGFAGGLPNLLVPLPAGALVDRWDRRRLMIFCDVGRGGALASLALALLLGRLSLAQILIVAFMEGTLAVLFRLAQLGAVRRVVPTEQLPIALSQEEGRIRGAGLLGPPVGGLLFGFGQLLPFQRRLRAKAVVIGANWAWAALMPLVLLVAQPVRARWCLRPDGVHRPRVERGHGHLPPAADRSSAAGHLGQSTGPPRTVLGDLGPGRAPSPSVRLAPTWGAQPPPGSARVLSRLSPRWA